MNKYYSTGRGKRKPSDNLTFGYILHQVSRTSLQRSDLADHGTREQSPKKPEKRAELDNDELSTLDGFLIISSICCTSYVFLPSFNVVGKIQ